MKPFDKGWNDLEYDNPYPIGSKEYSQYQLGWDQYEMCNWS